MTTTDAPEPPWTCDVCGRVIEEGTPVWGLGWDNEAHTGRHWECTAGERLRRSKVDFDEAIAKTEGLIKKLAEVFKDHD